MKLIKLLFITFALLLCSGVVCAHDFEQDGIYYKILSETDKTVEVTFKGGYFDSYQNEYSGSVVIPESATNGGVTYKVIRIGRYAFYNCSNLSSVTIGKGVTSIRDGAFSGCSSLTSIVIPDSVTSIGGSAFSNCSNLSSVTIGKGVTSIGEGAFYKCSSLTSIVIPDAVTSIGDEAFYRCSNLSSITLGKGVTSIGRYAFYNCSNLSSVTIGKGVTSIGYEAFCGCSSLTSIIVDESNQMYDSRNNCNAIIETSSNTLIAGCQNSIIPDGVTSIGSSAFYYCSSLTSIIIPDAVTSIGNYAFTGCTNLTSVVIPDAVTIIGEWAFESCSNLSSVTLGKGVTSIGYGAFSGCSKLDTVINYSPLTLIKGYSDYGYVGYYADKVINADEQVGDFFFKTIDGVHYLSGYLGKDKDLQLPENYQGNSYAIGKYAFYDDDSLISILIPDAVTSIGDYVFSYCSSLTSIIVDEDNLKYDSRNNCNAIIETSSNTLIAGCQNSIIPDGVTSIGDNAFYGCDNLSSVTIGKGVTSIGRYAFYDCDNLSSVTIGESVTSIGRSAFSDCSSLTSIVIPDAVTSIGESAFSVCSNLSSITIGKGVTSIGSDAFSGCTNLTSVVIPDAVTIIEVFAFYGCSNLSSVTIGEGVTSIGRYAFYDCSKIDTVINYSPLTITQGSSSYGYVGCYADKVINADEQVGDFFFKTIDAVHYLSGYLGKDKDLQLPENYQGNSYAIGDKAFYDCDSLTSVVIPDAVTSIGDYVFSYCSSLTSIIVDEDNIYYDSRNNCNAIIETSSNTLIAGCQNSIIPDGVTSIGDEAFSGCSSLTSIVIPDGVTNIGKFAFNKCNNLSSITIGESVTSIGRSAFYDCDSLTSIIVDEDNIYYDSRNNCNAIIETSSNTLIAGCQNSIIPDGVTSIGYEAFSGCSSLTSIVIPDAVTSIGDGAFSGCSNLKEITLGSSVEQIGSNFIYVCSALESITVAATTPPVIECLEIDEAYYNSITVYVPVGSLSAYQSANVWSRCWNIQEFDATGVVRPTISNEDIDAPVYNLNGERMMDKTNLPKGIYIQNGKKFIVR